MYNQSSDKPSSENKRAFFLDHFEFKETNAQQKAHKSKMIQIN